MGKLNWAKKAYALFLLCATTAIALPAQSLTALQSGSITPAVPDETIASPAQTFRVLHSFDGTDGAGPYAGLVQGTDGNLYGTTSSGGAFVSGTVFKITPSGALTTLYNFCSQSGCTDGQFPTAGLVQATDGNLYGTTELGGANGDGTVFKISPSGTLEWHYSFCSQSGCTDGQFPTAGLVQATDGNLYGTTYGGGANGYGTVFKITPDGALTTLYRFCSQSGCTDGDDPFAGLVQTTDGNLYGTTYGGGANGYGTVFKITPDGTLEWHYSFCSQSGCTDGSYPYAGLVQATDGNLYGTTYSGGSEGAGTVFKIPRDGTLTTLYNFCSQLSHGFCTDGTNPYAGLVLGSDGNLYGTTWGGGNYNYGTLFKITRGGTLTTLHSICSQSSCTDGYWMQAGLLQDTNGNFYGTTYYGGSSQYYQDGEFYFYDDGTVFSLSVGLGPFVQTQPTSGKVGEAVKILGTNLTGATGVIFHGKWAAFTVVSSSLITTTVPAGATAGFVEVVTPSRVLMSNVPFHVQSPGFSPESPGGEGTGN